MLCDPVQSPAPGKIHEEGRWIEVVMSPCLLTFFDWYLHLYFRVLFLSRQIFLATDSRNSSRGHSVLMLLSLSSVTNLSLLFGVE